MPDQHWLPLLNDESTQAARLLEAVLPQPLHTLGVDGVRAFAAPAPPPRTTPMATVEEHCVDNRFAVREYRPVDDATLPAILYFHGGGFMVGTLDGVDELCRRMAAGSGCAVFSVDYRLAPEHPYPAAVDDTRSAYDWLVANAATLGIDSSRLAVAGDSAGGGLAASLCLDLRARKLPQPALQLLVYPSVDDTFERSSWIEFADAPLLTTADAQWFSGHYIGARDVSADELAVPFRAETLAGLAPAHVITAEVDPLRDDAEAYADRLAADGVPMTRKRYHGVFHGFFTEVSVSSTANKAVRDACEQLCAALRSQPPLLEEDVDA
jgi:acetyl esterase